MLIMCFITNLLATVLIYLSHKNQLLLAKPLNKKLQLTGVALLVLNLFQWLSSFNLLSGVLLWLCCSMLLLSAMPVFAYLFTRKAQ